VAFAIVLPRYAEPAVVEIDLHGEHSCHRWPLGGLEIPPSALFAERP
jgi:hypothetical protein